MQRNLVHCSVRSFSLLSNESISESKGLNLCTYSSPWLPLKKSDSNTAPKLHSQVFSDQSKGQLVESQGRTIYLLISKY